MSNLSELKKLVKEAGTIDDLGDPPTVVIKSDITDLTDVDAVVDVKIPPPAPEADPDEEEISKYTDMVVAELSKVGLDLVEMTSPEDVKTLIRSYSNFLGIKKDKIQRVVEIITAELELAKKAV